MIEEDNQQEVVFRQQRIIIYLLVGVFAGICVLVWQNSLVGNSSEETALNTTTVTETAADVSTDVKVSEDTATEVKENDELASWKIYTNKTIGYKLKYPANWIVKEIDTTSEVTDKEVKYITISTPDLKYFLYFGLSKKGASYSITDRTGIGAGDIVKNGDITILDTAFQSDKLVDSKKAKEYFYPQSIKTSADGKWQFSGSFSATDKVPYSTVDMTNLEDRTTAEKILSTVEIL